MQVHDQSGQGPVTPEEDVAVGDEVSSAWFAAYALGLAYAHCPEEERRGQLCRVADGRIDMLEAAHGRLRDAVVAEPVVQERALDLLGAVIDRLGAVLVEPVLIEAPSESCMTLTV
jgi:hypothetical protein